MSSSPWTWGSRSTPPCHFSITKKRLFPAFPLISLLKYHYWVEHTLPGWKRTMEFSAQSCLTWDIPSLASSFSLDQYPEWANTASFCTADAGMWAWSCVSRSVKGRFLLGKTPTLESPQARYNVWTALPEGILPRCSRSPPLHHRGLFA